MAVAAHSDDILGLRQIRMACMLGGLQLIQMACMLERRPQVRMVPTPRGAANT